jgi:hypothetical protein
MIVVVKPKTTSVTVVPDNTEVVVNSPITTLGQMNDVDFGTLAPVTENDVMKFLNGKWTNTPVGADASYIFNQGSASDTWVINHNLGKFPNVTVIDSSGDEIEGNINYVNNQQIVLMFSAAFSGKAYLN